MPVKRESPNVKRSINDAAVSRAHTLADGQVARGTRDRSPADPDGRKPVSRGIGNRRARHDEYVTQLW